MAGDERMIDRHRIKIEGEVQPLTFDYKLEFYSRVSGLHKAVKSARIEFPHHVECLINKSQCRCLHSAACPFEFMSKFRGCHFARTAHFFFLSSFSYRSKVSCIKQILFHPFFSPSHLN